MNPYARLALTALALFVAPASCGTSPDSDPGAGGAPSGAGANVGGASSGAGLGGSSVGGVAAGGASGAVSVAGAGGFTAGAGGATAGAAGANGGSLGGGGASGSAGQGGGGGGGAGGSAGQGGVAGAGGAPVVLPPGVSDLFPRPGAANLCPDPPLRLTFSGAPSLGAAGSVRVFDAAAPASAVATVDFAVATVRDTIGGQAFNQNRPVIVDGNAVLVTLPSRALTYGKSYFVTVDAGAIRAPGNAAFSVAGSSAWTFRTAAAAPSSLASLRVALDGSGQLCSPQRAFDLVPVNNAARVTIDVGAGTYRGPVLFNGKRNVTLRGADRRGVVLSGINNDLLNPGTRGRALVGADDADGLILENLTIHNQTPQGGSQAEALRLQGCDQCVVRDVDLRSLQDTVLWSGRIYARNCTIEGNVDFVWGDGVAYFDSCEIKTVGRSGPIVQARNAAGAYGYVFVDSRITSDAGIVGATLARIDVTGYPGSSVAFVDCTLGSHISSAGWTITGGTPPSSLRFWEYRSRNTAGALVDTSARAAGSRQISAAEAATLRDKAAVLGGWVPPG